MSGWKAHFSQKWNNGRNKGSRSRSEESKRKSKKTEITQDERTKTKNIIINDTEGIKNRSKVEKDERISGRKNKKRLTTARKFLETHISKSQSTRSVLY